MSTAKKTSSGSPPRRIKAGDRMPARRTTKFYARQNGPLDCSKPARLGISFDAADMAVLARLQARRYTSNGGRLLGPTAIIREALLALDESERAPVKAAQE